MSRYACFVILCSLALAGCASDPETVSRAQIAKGDALAADGRFKDAIIHYRNALKAEPASAEAQRKLADAAARANDAYTAIPAMLRAAELNPDDVTAQVRAAAVYLLAGRYDEARVHAEAAVRADAGDAQGHIVLGQALARLHGPDEGEAALKQAVRVAPDSPDAHIALGSHYWSEGREAEAEAALRKAVTLGPAHPAANRALAMFHMARDRTADAEPLWRVVATSPGGDPLALADFFVATNRLGDAERALQALTASPATRDAARLRLAAVQYASGKPEAAHETVRGVLERDAEHVPALLLRAQFLQAEGRIDAALADADKAVAADAQSPDALIVQGTLQAARGDNERAVRAFKSALDLDRNDSAPYLAIGRIRLRERRGADAIEAAERARAIRPDAAAAHLLIEALAAAGNDGRARAEAEAAMRTWPSSATFPMELGAVELKQGDIDAARRSFTKALELDPGSIEALAGLVETDIQSGRPDQARARVAARLQGRDDPALVLLSARVHAATGGSSEAEAALHRLIASDPNNLEAFAALGELYLQEERLQEARAQFEKLAAQTQAAGPWTMVGMILEALGDKAGAQQKYEQTLARHPRAAVAANNLAWIYLGQGRLDEALQWATVASQELRRSPEVNDTLGWVHHARNQPLEAIPALTLSVEQRPENPLYRYHLGAAYQQAGFEAPARAELRRAVASKTPFAGREDAIKALKELDGRKD